MAHLVFNEDPFSAEDETQKTNGARETKKQGSREKKRGRKKEET